MKKTDEKKKIEEVTGPIEAPKKKTERSSRRKVGTKAKVEKDLEIKTPKNDNFLLYLGIVLSLVALIGLVMIMVGNNQELKNLEESISDNVKKITSNSVFLTTTKSEIDEISKKVVKNQKDLSDVSDLVINNRGIIDSTEEEVRKIERRVVTAQKGVNRLVRIKMLEYGHPDSLAIVIANELSINPTIAKWDTLRSEDLNKINQRLISLEKNSKAKKLAYTKEIEKVNNETARLDSLLQRKHLIVLKLLKTHGTKEMRKRLTK